MSHISVENEGEGEGGSGGGSVATFTVNLFSVKTIAKREGVTSRRGPRSGCDTIGLT